MKPLLSREDLLDELAEAMADRNDLDVGWHQFAEEAIRVLERHGVTFEEPVDQASLPTAADARGVLAQPWTALPFWSCRCPALPGDPCPLTIEECAERSRERHAP